MHWKLFGENAIRYVPGSRAPFRCRSRDTMHGVPATSRKARRRSANLDRSTGFGIAAPLTGPAALAAVGVSSLVGCSKRPPHPRRCPRPSKDESLPKQSLNGPVNGRGHGAGHRGAHSLRASATLGQNRVRLEADLLNGDAHVAQPVHRRTDGCFDRRRLSAHHEQRNAHRDGRCRGGRRGSRGRPRRVPCRRTSAGAMWQRGHLRQLLGSLCSDCEP